jgi:chromate reductase
MAAYKVGYFVGSLSSTSINRLLAKALERLAPPELVLTEIPIKDLPLYSPDFDADYPPVARALKQSIADVDAVLFVTPEYNRSIPGGLKNAIDWVSRMKDQPFKDKPVALQSAAGGILGGSRMQHHLRQSLTSVDALLFGRPEVIVTFAAQKFDEKTLELKDQTAIDMIKLQLSAFEQFIRRVSAKE